MTDTTTTTELDKKCPQCHGEIKDHRSGCETCEQFQCAGCGNWVPWDLGGDDNDEERPLCDLCVSNESDDGDPEDDDGAEPDPLEELEELGDAVDDDEPDGGGSIRA